MSVSVCLCLCLCLSLSLFLSLSLSLSLSQSLCLSVSLCLSLRLPLCVSVCLCVCLCVCLSVCLSPSLSVSLSVFIQLLQHQHHQRCATFFLPFTVSLTALLRCEHDLYMDPKRSASPQSSSSSLAVSGDIRKAARNTVWLRSELYRGAWRNDSLVAERRVALVAERRVSTWPSVESAIGRASSQHMAESRVRTWQSRVSTWQLDQGCIFTPDTCRTKST